MYQSEAYWFGCGSTDFLYIVGGRETLFCIKLFRYWSSFSYEQISRPLNHWNLTYKRHYLWYQEFKDRLRIQHTGNNADCIPLYPYLKKKSLLGQGKGRKNIHRHSKHASRFDKCLPDLGNKMHSQASIWIRAKANYVTILNYRWREIYLSGEIIIPKNYEFPNLMNTFSITTLAFLD